MRKILSNLKLSLSISALLIHLSAVIISVSFAQDHRDPESYEPAVLNIIETIKDGDLDSALVLADEHISKFPKSRVGHLLKADIRGVLAATVAEQTEREVRAQIEPMAPLIEENWGMTPALKAVIEAFPFVSDMAADARPIDLEGALADLFDLEFFSAARFREALQAPTREDGAPVFNAAMIELLVQAAAHPVPQDLRDVFADLARLGQLARHEIVAADG